MTGWVRFGLLAGQMWLAGAATAPAQTPLPRDQFDGWKTWPLVRPGGLELPAGLAAPLRLEYDALLPGPRGFGVAPLDSMTMWMDVRPARFHERPALWIEWLSSASRRPRAEPPALDALLVDRATFRLLFRVARSGPAHAWAGRYEVIHAAEERVVQVTVDDDGATTTSVLAGASGYFDFATYPFLFPQLDLRPGLGMRLAGYDYLAKKEEILAVRVEGQVDVTDAVGRKHRVWQVDVMPPHRATLISLFVTRDPPYFLGWDYRLTRDGSTAMRLTYRGSATDSTR